MIDEDLGVANWLFLISAVVTVAYQLFFFFIAAAFRFDKVTDLAGGTNFVLVAVLCFCVGPISQIPISISRRQWAVTLLVVLWGVRLSSFLFYRILVTSEDSRFDGVRDNLLKFAGFWLGQAVWVYVVSLPVMFVCGQTGDSAVELTAGDVAGWALAVLGLILETVADNQKFSFRQRQARLAVKEPFIKTGVWRWSRHPNYCGELFVWWGIFISASQALTSTAQYFIILSPLLITYLLLGASGMPILEQNANKRLGRIPDYHLYRFETSPLFPLPNFLYRSLPPAIKRYVFFEWDLFARGLEDELSTDLLGSVLVDAAATRQLSTSGRTTSIASRTTSVTNSATVPFRTASA